MMIQRRWQRLERDIRLRLLGLPRSAKLAAMVLFDLAAITIALTAAFSLRYGEMSVHNIIGQWWWLWIAIPLITIPTFVVCGLYRQVIRYIGARAAMQILVGVAAVSCFIPAVSEFAQYDLFRAAVMVNFFVIATAIIAISRFAMRTWFGTNSSKRADRVIIWGAGYAGVQLAQALHAHRRWTPVAFVDDDHKLWGRVVHRLPCINPKNLDRFARRKGVGTVILALPSASRTRTPRDH